MATQDLSLGGNDRVRVLPNDIYVVSTAAGDILVNSPPETLKYLLAAGLKPPKTVLLPPDIPAGQQLGSSGFVRHGINYASVEFLMYSNFFGAGVRTRLITVTSGQAERLRRILAETVSGPHDLAAYGPYAWLQRECAAVRFFAPKERGLDVDDMVEISSLEAGGGQLGEVAIRFENGSFIFNEHDRGIASISTETTRTPVPPTVAPPRPLLRQELTLQFVGASHGFDPVGITTCFLAYIGSTTQSGPLLFDCAAYLRTRLANLGVSTGQLDSVVLSHLHEDHLAGLPELALRGEHRVRLITSDIVYDGLLRVMSAMLAVPESHVASLFDYHPLNPGHPLELDGRTFEAIYAVHAVPTLAVSVGGLCYSGDMRYDETWFSELESQGILSSARRAELLRFAEGAEILVQDVGGGNVHSTLTPELIERLAAKGQRIVLAHTSDHRLPPTLGIQAHQVEFAGSGHVVAVGEAVADAHDMEREERVATVSACPLYARLPIAERFALARQAVLTDWTDGQVVMHEGDPSDSYAYIVHSGLVEIWEQGKRIQVLGRGSSVGERGVLTGEPRTTTVVAHGAMQLLRLDRELFGLVAERLELAQAFARAEWLWRHPVFGHLPWATLLDLALDFQPQTVAPGHQLYSAGDLAHEGYLLVAGAVEVLDTDGTPLRRVAQPGEFFGIRAALYGMLRDTAACVTEVGEVWMIPAAGVERLVMVNPSMILHLGLTTRMHQSRSPGSGGEDQGE